MKIKKIIHTNWSEVYIWIHVVLGPGDDVISNTVWPEGDITGDAGFISKTVLNGIRTTTCWLL